jgi:hypothetical protein
MLAVVRVSEEPEPPIPSVEKTCGSCEKPVWVSKGNDKLSDRCDIICPPCLAALATTSQN